VVEVPQDQNDLEFQAFLSWNSALMVPVTLANLPPNGLIFLGVDPLVAWCKHAGVMLYAVKLGQFGTGARFQQAGSAHLVQRSP
jgi:hypothetical protein